MEIDTDALERNGKQINTTGDRLAAENASFQSKYDDFSEAILACKEA